MVLSNVFSALLLSSSIVKSQSTPSRLIEKPIMCPMDMFKCADGSWVSRDPKLNCQFPPCAVDLDQIMCPADVQQCPDGSWVSRDPKNGCAFPPCPDIVGCAEDAKQCPDGSWVSRDPANNCEFEACPIPIEEVGCGIDHCNSYFDGCNQCGCGNGGRPFCTLKYCYPDWMKKPFCTGCEPGYILNKATNKCEGCVCTADYNPVCCNGKTYSNQCRASCEQATECVPGACGMVEKPCGGFDNCLSYYDGCNNCKCGTNGFAACTRMMCFRKDTPECLQCAKGYILKGGVCVGHDLILY